MVISNRCLLQRTKEMMNDWNPRIQKSKNPTLPWSIPGSNYPDLSAGSIIRSTSTWHVLKDYSNWRCPLSQVNIYLDEYWIIANDRSCWQWVNSEGNGRKTKSGKGWRWILFSLRTLLILTWIVCFQDSEVKILDDDTNQPVWQPKKRKACKLSNWSN